MHRTLDIEPLGAGNAQLVRGDVSLLDLPSSAVQALLERHGALVFRGFGATPWLMKAFAERFSTRFNRDRLRPPVENSDGYVQLVTEGMGYVEPHSEQANTPFRPDAIWFCCEAPAAEGGETLLWDGIALLEHLSKALQTRLRDKHIRYFQRYTEGQWTLFLGGNGDLAEARRLLDGLDRVTYHVDSRRTIYLEYVCPAIVRTRFGAIEAFANSLVSERANTLGPLMRFSDGESITEADIDEIQLALHECRETISWQSGDLAMIDNSRFMHGRTAYSDQRRKIYSSLSYLNF